jgi:hypothetical protein
VHLAGHASGQVAVTDIHDGFVDNAIEVLKAGDFVRCRVLGQAEAKGDDQKDREKGAALGFHQGFCPMFTHFEEALLTFLVCLLQLLSHNF